MTEFVQQISDDWRAVNWPQVERTVFRLQQRIYRDGSFAGYTFYSDSLSERPRRPVG